MAFSRVVYTSRNSSAGALEERLIGVTAPSGDLAATSKVVFKAPGNCSSLLLTPDGGTVVCGTAYHPLVTGPADCAKNEPMFVAYSAATGKRLRILYQYTGPCTVGLEYRAVVGRLGPAGDWQAPENVLRRSALSTPSRYGVAAAGTFAQFSFRPHGQWYSGPAF